MFNIQHISLLLHFGVVEWMGNGGNLLFSYLTSTSGWSLLNSGCQSCATLMKIMLNSTAVFQKYIGGLGSVETASFFVVLLFVFYFNTILNYLHCIILHHIILHLNHVYTIITFSLCVRNVNHIHVKFDFLSHLFSLVLTCNIFKIPFHLIPSWHGGRLLIPFLSSEQG